MAEENNSVEEHIIGIVETNETVPIFTSISMEELNGSVDSKTVHSENSSLNENVVINGNMQHEPSPSDGNFFMVTPLLQVRQSAIQDRIAISADEIERRVSTPESLSEAHILNLLRLNKEGSKNLRSTLNKFGVKDISERSAVVSSFSRLSEAESEGLAEDYYYLASRFMKVREMNKNLQTENGGEAFFSQKAKSTRLILEQIFTEIEKKGSELTTLTHGFSPLVLRGVFNILIEILDHKDKDSIIENSEKSVSI